MEHPVLEKKIATFDVEETAKALSSQVAIETIEDFKFVIEKISNAFNAVIGTTDRETIRESLRDMRMNEGYLAEKYRDTPEEIRYIKKVNEAITYLEGLEKKAINEETITEKSSEKADFEGLLIRDDFFEEIKNLDEANGFKLFLNERFNLLANKEKTAERNYNSNQSLKAYRELRDASHKIDQFMYNELDAEYGSDEWKKEEEKIADLDRKAEKMLEDDQELKKLVKELGETWNQAINEKNVFLRHSKAPDKIKIINEVLIPYFEQEDKVRFLSDNGKEKLEKTRDSLYESLERNPEDEKIEEQIRTVERDLEHFDSSLRLQTEKLERMKNNLSSNARRIYSTISR